MKQWVPSPLTAPPVFPFSPTADGGWHPEIWQRWHPTKSSPGSSLPRGKARVAVGSLTRPALPCPAVGRAFRAEFHGLWWGVRPPGSEAPQHLPAGQASAGVEGAIVAMGRREASGPSSVSCCVSLATPARGKGRQQGGEGHAAVRAAPQAGARGLRQLSAPGAGRPGLPRPCGSPAAIPRAKVRGRHWWILIRLTFILLWYLSVSAQRSGALGSASPCFSSGVLSWQMSAHGERSLPRRPGPPHRAPQSPAATHGGAAPCSCGEGEGTAKHNLLPLGIGSMQGPSAPRRSPLWSCSNQGDGFPGGRQVISVFHVCVEGHCPLV